MKKYFISIFLILTIFSLTNDVNAADIDVFKDLELPNFVTITDCDSTHCEEINSEEKNWSSVYPELDIPYVQGNTTTFGSNGAMITFSANNGLMANYLYSITTYQCLWHPSVSGPRNLKELRLISAGSYANLLNKNYTGIYTKMQSRIQLTDPHENYVGGDDDSLTCFSYSYFFVPAYDSTYIGFNLTTSTSGTVGALQFYGYKMESLGMYSSAYESIIEEALANSNLATQDDIDALNSQIQNQIREQEETNDKLDDANNKLDGIQGGINDTNDYLQDTTPPNSDISGLGNVQGLLPPGPVDSLLNIPFKFLSVINSSLGGVCVPLTGPFVFDSTLTLPCFKEIFYDEVDEGILNFLSLIPATFILIMYLKHLYKKVNRAVSLETTADDEWGVL